jgi:hypothetical protein
MGCVEVTVSQMITHPDDLRPRNRWLGVQQVGGQRLDGLAGPGSSQGHQVTTSALADSGLEIGDGN